MIIKKSHVYFSYKAKYDTNSKNLQEQFETKNKNFCIEQSKD